MDPVDAVRGLCAEDPAKSPPPTTPVGIDNLGYLDPETWPNHFKRTCVVESVIAGLFPDVAGGDVGGREVVVRLRVAHGREDGGYRVSLLIERYLSGSKSNGSFGL